LSGGGVQTDQRRRADLKVGPYINDTRPCGRVKGLRRVVPLGATAF